MRAFLALALVAVVAAACGITSSTSEPVREAPSLDSGEQPSRVVPLAGGATAAPLTLSIYDRSLALDEARTATPAELAGVEQLDPDAIGAYQTKTGEVLVTWTGSACPGAGDMFVGPGASEIVIVKGTSASCGAGDTVRGVYLLFRPTVDLKRITFTFARPAGRDGAGDRAPRGAYGSTIVTLPRTVLSAAIERSVPEKDSTPSGSAARAQMPPSVPTMTFQNPDPPRRSPTGQPERS
jgi:hypothetical protein